MDVANRLFVDKFRLLLRSRTYAGVYCKINRRDKRNDAAGEC